MFDERIVPGAWVQTRFGKAVCIEVQPHTHSLVPWKNDKGWNVFACENDDCKGQRHIYFRYRARRYTHDKDGKINGTEDHDIWVANGDLSGEAGDMVKFLAPPTRFTARIVKLEGPYGEGKPACGPYISGYCACGEPVHG